MSNLYSLLYTYILCQSAVNCNVKKNKGSADADGLSLLTATSHFNFLYLDKKNAKKRKASPTPDEPAKKKNKIAPKVTKGRMKGPLDLDKQCGVINDKGVPCSRALTCKSHSMGAKRAVEGRSRKYDDLLIEYQRANNPNFIEPAKRESKAEKKEKREKEKQEKKRLAEEAAAAMGIDISKKGTQASSSLKKLGKKATVRLIDVGEDTEENLNDVDSETEVDDLVQSVRIAREKGVIGLPLAVPCDAGSWFVQSRERARVCRDLLLNALASSGAGIPAGLGGMSIGRTASMGIGVPQRIG